MPFKSSPTRLLRRMKKPLCDRRHGHRRCGRRSSVADGLRRTEIPKGRIPWLSTDQQPTGRLEFVESVDVRGNSDETWRHEVDYLLRNYLMRKP
jgi:hypothetical protein